MKERDGLHFDPDKKPSEHTRYWAMDFWIEWVFPGGARERVTEEDLYDYLDDTYPNSAGIGFYSGRIHFDPRPNRARWGNRPGSTSP